MIILDIGCNNSEHTRQKKIVEILLHLRLEIQYLKLLNTLNKFLFCLDLNPLKQVSVLFGFQFLQVIMFMVM
jgi:hypothetical protein